jgi:hypothetical protein
MPLWKFRTFEEAESHLDHRRYAVEQLRSADRG